MAAELAVYLIKTLLWKLISGQFQPARYPRGQLPAARGPLRQEHHPVQGLRRADPPGRVRGARGGGVPHEDGGVQPLRR